MKYAVLILVWLSTYIGIAKQTMQNGPGPEFSINELLIAMLIIPALVICSIGLLAGILGIIFIPSERRYFALLTVVSIIAPAMNFF